MAKTALMAKQMRFQPRAVRRFRFVGYDFDDATLTARLRYAFDDGPRFCEEVVFDGGRVPESEEARAALDRTLRHLHLAAGISYYKAAVPPEIAAMLERVRRDSF